MHKDVISSKPTEGNIFR